MLYFSIGVSWMELCWELHGINSLCVVIISMTKSYVVSSWWVQQHQLLAELSVKFVDYYTVLRRSVIQQHKDKHMCLQLLASLLCTQNNWF